MEASLLRVEVEAEAVAAFGPARQELLSHRVAGTDQDREVLSLDAQVAVAFVQ